MDRDVKSNKATHGNQYTGYYSRINQRIYQEPYKNIKINLQNTQKIDKSPFIDRNKWMIKPL